MLSRSVHRVAAALLATVLWAAVLGGLAGPADAAARTDLVLGMAVEPPGLDPTVAAPVAIGQVVWQNVFEGLTRIDAEGRVQPQLATQWSVSPDGLRYSFSLARGVTFHNGTPFTAETAKFTLDRIRAEGSVNPQKALYAVIKDVLVEDPQTLVLELSSRSSNLLFWLGLPTAVMLEPGSAETARTAPVGTGPFRFFSWRKGDRVELVRNETYWDKAEAARLERVTFRFIGDPQAQSAALQAGDVDAIPLFAAPELYGAFEDDPRFVAKPGVTEMKVVAGLNTTKAPLNDVRVRRALMMAVDREMLVEGVASGFGTPIGSHYTPNDPGYRDLSTAIPYDPDAAKALLTEAGYPDGFALTIKTPQMPYASRSAEVLQALFSEIGVTLTIAPTEFPARWVQEVMRDKAFDMTIIAHAEPLDLGLYANPGNYFGYHNPDFDAAIATAVAAPDEPSRLAAYGTAQEILARDVPALFLYVQPKLSVWAKGLTGYWQNEPVPSNDVTEVEWAE